jgi:hypothetical protein
VDEPTEQVPPANVAQVDRPGDPGEGQRWSQADGTVRSLPVVVLRVGPKRSIQMPPTEDEGPVEPPAVGQVRRQRRLARGPPSRPTTAGTRRSRTRSATSSTGWAWQATWAESPGSQIRVDLTPEEAALVRYVTQQGVDVASLLHISYGAQISGGAGEDFARTRYLAGTPARMQNPKAFVEGRDLRPFSLRWPGQYLDYRPDQFYGPRSPELFESPKLVVRHLSGEGSSLIALVDGNGYYMDHGSILGVPREPECLGFSDLHAIAAVLNSTVGNFLYMATQATESLQGTYSHVYPIAVKRARLPSSSLVRETLGLTDVVRDRAFTTRFGDPATRRAGWWSICSTLGQRLHQVARAMFDRAEALTTYAAHLTGNGMG